MTEASAQAIVVGLDLGEEPSKSFVMVDGVSYEMVDDCVEIGGVKFALYGEGGLYERERIGGVELKTRPDTLTVRYRPEDLSREYLAPIFLPDCVGKPTPRPNRRRFKRNARKAGK